MAFSKRRPGAAKNGLARPMVYSRRGSVMQTVAMRLDIVTWRAGVGVSAQEKKQKKGRHCGV